MARKKSTGKRGKAKGKKKTAVSIRRSSGRKEKFDVGRMAQTTGRSGVPFMMARDIAKNVSKKIRSEAREKGRGSTVTAGRVRKMVAKELQDRNQQAIASSYTGEVPKNRRSENAKVGRYESPVGSADTDQHEAYRADRDSVLHDRSKRLASAA